MIHRVSAGSNEGQQAKLKCLSANPIGQPQVDQQLDSASFSMDALESTMVTLLSRLIPVTGLHPEEDYSPSPTPELVPIAARINHLEERVRNVEARLLKALRNLQV